VFLPATKARTDDRPAGVSSPPPGGNNECVLVIDDEDLILNVTSRVLRRFGYRVLTARDGAAAVACYAQKRNEIAVVVTDLIMPIMDGPTTIRAIRQMNPNACVVATSGYGTDDLAARAMAAGACHQLPKPYTSEDLLAALHQALNGNSNPKNGSQN
jgi:CheY-like chemotaxis protein